MGKINKRIALQYLGIVAIALALGAGAGWMGKYFLGEPDISYGNVSLDRYQIDANELIARVESSTANDKTGSFSPVDLANYALEKYKRCEYNFSYGRGMANTIVAQVIQSCQIKNGNKYFEESLSESSMVHVANRMFQDGIGNNIDFYTAPSNAVNLNGLSGYSKTPINYTSEDYKNSFGRTLDEMFIYIIHRDTVIESSAKKNSDSTYTVTLSLDPIWSTYKYKYQMLNISGLDKLPNFKYVNLTYTLNSDLTLKGCHVNEAYTAKMGVEVEIRNDIDYVYHANEFYPIPTLEEAFDYHVDLVD